MTLYCPKCKNRLAELLESIYIKPNLLFQCLGCLQKWRVEMQAVED